MSSLLAIGVVGFVQGYTSLPAVTFAGICGQWLGDQWRSPHPLTVTKDVSTVVVALLLGTIHVTLAAAIGRYLGGTPAIARGWFAGVLFGVSLYVLLPRLEHNWRAGRSARR